jgi:hypothetical protein
MKQWEKEYHEGKSIGKIEGHWAPPHGAHNGGPMLVAMCEVKEHDLRDARPKWVVSNFWSKEQDRGNGYSTWGNYPVVYWGSEPVAGRGQVTFFSAKDTPAFGDLGDVWHIHYGTTIGTHQGDNNYALSDKFTYADKICEPNGKKLKGCGPTTLPDGIKMRKHGNGHAPPIPATRRLASGHPGQSTVAMNADGVLARCSQGDARGPSCLEIHKVKGQQPKDWGFIMSTLPVGEGLTEMRGTIVPRPPGKGWIFVNGKGIKWGPQKVTYVDPSAATQVAVCTSLKGGTTLKEECGGSGYTEGKPYPCGPKTKEKPQGVYMCSGAKCNKMPQGKIISKPGQIVDEWTVQAAKLGGRNTDRYLIGYQVRTDPLEMWIMEVDGTCEPTYGPYPVAIPSGAKGPLWGQQGQFTTTKSGKIVSVAPNENKEDGVMIFTHVCQSC